MRNVGYLENFSVDLFHSYKVLQVFPDRECSPFAREKECSEAQANEIDAYCFQASEASELEVNEYLEERMDRSSFD